MQHSRALQGLTQHEMRAAAAFAGRTTDPHDKTNSTNLRFQICLDRQTRKQVQHSRALQGLAQRVLSQALTGREPLKGVNLVLKGVQLVLKGVHLVQPSALQGLAQRVLSQALTGHEPLKQAT